MDYQQTGSFAETSSSSSPPLEFCIEKATSLPPSLVTHLALVRWRVESSEVTRAHTRTLTHTRTPCKHYRQCGHCLQRARFFSCPTLPLSSCSFFSRFFFRAIAIVHPRTLCIFHLTSYRHVFTFTLTRTRYFRPHPVTHLLIFFFCLSFPFIFSQPTVASDSTGLCPVKSNREVTWGEKATVPSEIANKCV